MEVIKLIKVTPNQSGLDFLLATMAPDIAKKVVPMSSKKYCNFM
jgi:hypothetical protein